MLFSSNPRLGLACRFAIYPTFVSLLAPLFYTLWALYGSEQRSDLITWAKYFGAIGPLESSLSQEWWRLLSAPLLHAHLEHLASNGLLIYMALAVLCYTELPIAGTFKPRFFKVTLSLFSVLYLALSGALIALIRFILNVPSWSIGCSGAALAILTLALIRFALIDHERSLWKRSFIVLSPMLLFFKTGEGSVDLSSHMIGICIGSVSAIGDHLFKSSHRS